MLKQLLGLVRGAPKRKLENAEAIAERAARDLAPTRIVSAFKEFEGPDTTVEAVPVDGYVHLMKKEIEELKHEIGFDQEDWEAIVAPMLRRYFEWVHLLPASASNHHARLGGLALHGLHVATLAARAAHNNVFDFSPMYVNDTELRTNRQPRWLLAAATAGLVHDIGKVLVDQIVTDADNGRVWNPFACSMTKWIKENDVKTYAVRYRSGDRLERHETITVTMFGEIAGPEVKGALSQFGRDMMEAVTMSISGEKNDNFGLRKIVHQADMDSTRMDKDARHAYWSEGGDGADPLINRMLQTVPALIKNRSWFINRIGNPIWVTSDGVYLIWPQAFNGMRGELVATYKATGIPNDPHEMANIFIRAKIAKPRKLANGQVIPLWAVHLPEPDRAVAGSQAAQQMAEFKAQFGSISNALFIPDVAAVVGSTPIVHTADIRIADDQTMPKIEVTVVVPADASPPAADQLPAAQTPAPPAGAPSTSEFPTTPEAPSAVPAASSSSAVPSTPTAPTTSPIVQAPTQSQGGEKPTAVPKRPQAQPEPITNFDDELEDALELQMISSQMGAPFSDSSGQSEMPFVATAESVPAQAEQVSLAPTSTTIDPPAVQPAAPVAESPSPASNAEEILSAAGPLGNALIRVAQAVAGAPKSSYPVADMVVTVTFDEVMFKWPNSVRDLISNLPEVGEQLKSSHHLLAEVVKGQRVQYEHGITTGQRHKGRAWNVMTPNKELCAAYSALVESLKASK